MKNLIIYDPTKKDPVSRFRGGGRIIQILKENFPQAGFISNLSQIFNYQLDNGRSQVGNEIFLNPFFNPFQLPTIFKRIAKKQIQIIFDVIPLKYPKHFPIGIKGKFNLWLNKLMLKNYDKIITISHHSKKDIIRYLEIPEDKIEVIYPTLSQIFFKPKPKVDFQLPVSNFCLYVGDVNWNKNLVNLAKAIKLINISCVFVGKTFEDIIPKSKVSKHKQNLNSQTKNIKQDFGLIFQISNLNSITSIFNHSWQKEFRDFLFEVGDDKRFIFLGYVDDYHLIKLYQQARLNILISRDEGFGFSFLEAASQSCPSVLSDIDIFHEIAGNSSLFAKTNDPYDIAHKIGEIYFNNELRNELGFKALKISKNFERKIFLNKIKEALNF